MTEKQLRADEHRFNYNNYYCHRLHYVDLSIEIEDTLRAIIKYYWKFTSERVYQMLFTSDNDKFIYTLNDLAQRLFNRPEFTHEFMKKIKQCTSKEDVTKMIEQYDKTYTISGNITYSVIDFYDIHGQCDYYIVMFYNDVNALPSFYIFLNVQYLFIKTFVNMIKEMISYYTNEKDNNAVKLLEPILDEMKILTSKLVGY